MKYIVTLLFFAFTANFLLAQNGIKQYLDKNKFSTTNGEDVVFYRLLKYTESGKPIGLVKDYYLTDTLQFEGILSSEQPDSYEGTCVWYYPNGQKQRQAYYLNGEIAGRITEWNEEGRTLYEGVYKAGKQTGRHIFWDEKGDFKEVAFYHNGQELNITEIFTTETKQPLTTKETLHQLSKVLGGFQFLKDAADAYAFNNFGEMMLEQRKYIEALSMFFVSKEIREILSMPDALAKVNQNIALAYQSSGNSKPEQVAKDNSPASGKRVEIARLKTKKQSEKPVITKDRNKALEAYQESIVQTEELLNEQNQTMDLPTLPANMPDDKPKELTRVSIVANPIALNPASSFIPTIRPISYIKPLSTIYSEKDILTNTVFNSEEEIEEKSVVRPIRLSEDIISPRLEATQLSKTIVQSPIDAKLPISKAQESITYTEIALEAKPEIKKTTTEVPLAIPQKQEPIAKTEMALVAKPEIKHTTTKSQLAIANTQEPIETDLALVAKPEIKNTAIDVPLANKPSENKTEKALTYSQAALALPGAKQRIAAIEDYLINHDANSLNQTLSAQLGRNINAINKQDAVAVNDLMKLLVDMGAYAEVTATFNNKADALKTIKSPDAKATILQGIGNAYFQQHYFHQALQSYEQAAKLTLTNQQSNHAKIAAKLGMVNIYISKQEFAKASSILSELLNSSEKNGNDAQTALISQELGDVQFRMGEYDKALGYYQKASETYETTANRAASANMVNRMANMHCIKGNYPAAENQYKQAKELANRLKLPTLSAAVLNNMGVMYQMRGDLVQADTLYNQSLRQWKTQGNDLAQLPLWLNTAALMTELGKNKEAFELYKNYQQQQLRYNEFSYQEQQLLTIKNPQDVGAYIVQLALQLSKQDEAFSMAEMEKTKLAANFFTQPETNLSPDLSPTLKAEEVYWQNSLHALQLQLSLSNNIVQSKQLTATIETMTLGFDQFKLQLRQQAPDYARLKYPEPLSIEQVQNALLPDEIMVNYIVAGQNVYACVIAKTVYQFYSLETTANLELEVNNFYHLYLFPALTAAKEANKKVDKKINEAYTQNAARLYKKLIAPFYESITSAKRLIIVPDAFLNTLPFGVLIPNDSIKQYQQYNYLAKQFPIVYYPSASQFCQQAVKEITQISPENKQILVVANTTLKSENNTTLPTYFDILNGVTPSNPPVLESTDIKPVFAPYKAANLNILQQSQASEDKLKLIKLQDYQYLHFSTPLALHITQPQLSGFLLNGHQGGNALLTLPEINALKPKAELCTIPFTYNSNNEPPNGQEIFALQYGLMESGIDAAIIGLWMPGTKEANRFFTPFYADLANGVSKANALQNTQIQLINSTEFSNPIYWGGVTLTGK